MDRIHPVLGVDVRDVVVVVAVLVVFVDDSVLVEIRNLSVDPSERFASCPFRGLDRVDSLIRTDRNERKTPRRVRACSVGITIAPST